MMDGMEYRCNGWNILYMLSLLIMLSGAYRLDRWCRVIIYIFLSFFVRGGEEFFNKQNPWGRVGQLNVSYLVLRPSSNVYDRHVEVFIFAKFGDTSTRNLYSATS
jgi:hypothetical protein